MTPNIFETKFSCHNVSNTLLNCYLRVLRLRIRLFCSSSDITPNDFCNLLPTIPFSEIIPFWKDQLKNAQSYTFYHKINQQCLKKALFSQYISMSTCETNVALSFKSQKSKVKWKFLSMRVQRSKRAFFLAGWQRKEKETLPTKNSWKKSAQSDWLEYKVKRQATGKFRLKSTQLVWVALNFLKAGLWTVK